jgi:hypothetical protein
MRCEQFERRLQEVLDDRGAPEFDDMLREHAELCPECRELSANYDRLLSSVSATWVPSGSRQLTSRVIDRWQESFGQQLETAQPIHRRRTWQVVAGSLACAVALFVAILPLLQTDRSELQPVNGAGNSPVSSALVDDASPDSRSGHGLAAARTSLSPKDIGVMAHETGRGLAMLVLQFPDYDNAGSMGHPDGERDWLTPVTSTLKPFTPVGEPFNVLLRATGTRGGPSRSS